MDVTFVWEGRSLTVRPDFDLYLRIDSEIPLQTLLQSIIAAPNDDAASVHVTHLAVFVWHHLNAAGEDVSRMEVLQKCLKTGNEWGKLIGHAFTQFYPKEVAKETGGNAKAGKSRQKRSK